MSSAIPFAAPASAVSATPLQIVDFHSHFVGTTLRVNTAGSVPPAMRAFWEGVDRRLSDPAELLGAIDRDGIAARVINTSLEFVRSGQADVPAELIRRVNDATADTVNRHADKLHGLATVDAYTGETGAREFERAVTELGLRGLFMESAKGALLPNAPEARPTLEVAARLGVPIFLHPVPQPDLKKFFAATGQFNERFSRGTINAAALLAMMEAGIFEELPGLRVVATALSLGGLMLGECFGGGAKLGRDFAAQRQIYLDTTGLHPVMLRAALDLLGTDRLVFGTDWPVVQEPGLAVKLTRLLTDCGLTAMQQQAVAGGTALRLMGVQQLH